MRFGVDVGPIKADAIFSISSLGVSNPVSVECKYGSVQTVFCQVNFYRKGGLPLYT